MTTMIGRLLKSAQEFMQEARAATGIDIADTAVEEPLERLLASLNSDAGLSASGAVAMEHRLLRLLTNRLRMERDFLAHPEIAAQKIERPLILTGGPRTGSTKLHKLLAASGDFHFLPFWQGHCMALRTGDRAEDPAPRIAEAQAYVQWIADHAPLAQLNHGYATFAPEEEALLLEHHICSTFPNVFAHVPAFMQWWAAQDFVAQIAYLKRCLQYLQWQFHDGDRRPWVLKCPIYVGAEAALKTIFPDAVFVTTNRTPLSTVPSTVNLVQGYQQAYSDVDRRRLLGQAFLEGLSTSTRQHLELRRSRPDIAFLDISFAMLTKASEQVVEAVYAHAAMTLSDEARQSMRAWEAADGHHDRPPPYAMEDFGLDREGIMTTFSGYIARFGTCF